jgi:hypothetical protein
MGQCGVAEQMRGVSNDKHVIRPITFAILPQYGSNQIAPFIYQPFSQNGITGTMGHALDVCLAVRPALLSKMKLASHACLPRLSYRKEEGGLSRQCGGIHLRAAGWRVLEIVISSSLSFLLVLLCLCICTEAEAKTTG